jgi:predicted nucleotidyltransferase
MTPEQLVERLEEALAGDLRSVVLYGSAVAGERIAVTSDYNILVIVSSLGLDRLHAAGRAMAEWLGEGNTPPLVFTEEEWRASADVFPMEFADILERNRVLHGQPPFDGIAVRRADLRLQVEQDARGKLLHLRQAVIAAEAADGSAHLAILEQTLSKVMILYRALLRLHDTDRPTDYEQLTRAAARAAGFDAEPVLAVVRHVRGERRLGESDGRAAAESYLATLEQLVRHLDGVE